jgi:SAM-dependent methyltransferase
MIKKYLERMARKLRGIQTRRGGVMDHYSERLVQERERFDAEINVHDLPDIFHYWSNKYLRPLLNSFGYDNIEDFFALELASLAVDGRALAIASVGSGDCATEVEVARRLREKGLVDFQFTCMDISGEALRRGQEIAAAAGMAGHFRFLPHDFNTGIQGEGWDAVMANQSLHHVLHLETLFDSIRDRLADHGCLLTSDMIGRNGHQRWPEARTLVDEAWQWLPGSYRFNRQLNRQEDSFLDWDCAQEGFEGVRAQDILPLLLARFQPSVFLAWGNIIDVFIDRGFGHGFHRKTEWDLHFIDQVHALDEAAMLAGTITPTHLLARFQKGDAKECVHRPGLSPAVCIREDSLVR